MTDDELGSLGITRRNFIKKMVAIGFAVPIVSSFTLDGVAEATQHRLHHGNQTQDHYPPNQTIIPFPNQTLLPFPNQSEFRFPFSNQVFLC